MTYRDYIINIVIPTVKGGSDSLSATMLEAIVAKAFRDGFHEGLNRVYSNSELDKTAVETYMMEGWRAS